MRRLFAAIAFISVVLITAEAHADTLGSVFCRVSENLMPFGSLLNSLAYIGGGIMIGSGVIHLQKHADGNSSSPLLRGVAYCVSGGCLLALPAFANLLVNSLYANQSVSGLSACVADGSASAGQ